MWRRRKWMLVAILAVVVVLVGGVIGGVVYAQTSTPTATPNATNPGNALLAKVAQILGIDQQTLQNAFTQAEKEVQSDALQQRLANLVQQGKLTQDQANQYEQWWNSRPNVPAGLDGLGKLPGNPKMFRGGGFGFRFFPGANGATPTPSATQ
jgi:hypothetical protein